MRAEIRAACFAGLLSWLGARALLPVLSELEQATPPARATLPDATHGAHPLALPELDLEQRLKELEVSQSPSGLSVRVDADGAAVQLSPEEYVRSLQQSLAHQKARGLIFRLFNITTPWGILWVSIGFLGQALFTYRMLVQWMASERNKRSVIPIGYWWGSLFGGITLLVYFIWRKDIVGIIGQSTGGFIYVHNLILIYRSPAAVRAQLEGKPWPPAKPTA